MRKTLYRPENIVLIELLRDRRLALGLRQVEVADRLGVFQNFVSHVESGVRRLDLLELRDYAAALESSIKEIVDQWERRLADQGYGASQKMKAPKTAAAIAPRKRAARRQAPRSAS